MLLHLPNPDRENDEPAPLPAVPPPCSCLSRTCFVCAMHFGNLLRDEDPLRLIVTNSTELDTLYGPVHLSCLEHFALTAA